MNLYRPLIILSFMLSATPSLSEEVQVEKLGDLGEIFGNAVGNYAYQDGIYSITIPNKNTNGEDLDCIVFKDTTAVLNLQGTPQALAMGISGVCNWFPQKTP